MPVRGLDKALTGLVQVSSLKSLEGTRLGIDLAHLLRKILLTPSSLATNPILAAEPFVYATHQIPIILESTLKHVLATFKANKIEPVFVVNGLGLKRKERPFRRGDSRTDPRSDTRSEARAFAWSSYSKQNTEQAMKSWQSQGLIQKKKKKKK